MRRIIAFSVAGLVVLAAGAAGYWYQTAVRPLEPQPAPPALLAAEEALAVPGLFIIGHLDIGYAVRAERAYFGPVDAGALPAPISGEHAFLQNLRAAGLDPRRVFQHALFGFGLFGERTEPVLILLGDFPADRIATTLERSFDVERDTVGDVPILRITLVNPDTCGTRSLIAHVADDHIVLAQEFDTLSTVVDRLETGQPAERDLTDWRSVRADKVASIGFMVPSTGPIEVTGQGMMARAAANAIQQDAFPIRSSYAGVSLEALPPGAGLQGWIEARSPEWPLEAQTVTHGWRQEIADAVGDGIPTLLQLYDRLDIEADGSRLQFALSFDAGIANEIRSAFNEGTDLVLSGAGLAGGSRTSTADAPAEETIPPEQVPDTSVTLAHDRLAPIDGNPGMPQWQAAAGPFGLRVAQLRINAEDPSVIDIELEAASSEIPRLLVYPDSDERRDARAELVVTGVLDRNGGNLLRSEPCGEERNDRPTALEPRTASRLVDEAWVESPQLAGRKTVRLAPGARLEDIVSLEGHIRLALPTEIEAHRIAMPEPGDVFETDDLRMWFRSGDPGELAYRISGERGRLLEIRALNAAGAYLAQGRGGIRINFNRSLGIPIDIGSGREEKAFRGEPAEIELLIAGGEDVREYPFRIDAVIPARPEWNFSESSAEARWTEPMSQSSFDRLATTPVPVESCQSDNPGQRVGPFRLCLSPFLRIWRDEIHGTIGLRSAVDDRFADHLSAFEITIDSLVVPGQSGGPPRNLAADGARSRTYISDLQQYGQPSLQGWEQISGALAGSEDPGDDDPIGLRGRLSLRMPKALSTPLSLDITSLGARAANAEGTEVRLTGFEFRHDLQITIDYRGPRTDLLEVVQRGDDGTVVGAPEPSIEPGEQPDTWTLTMNISHRTRTLDFILATAHHRRDYPFDLVVPD